MRLLPLLLRTMVYGLVLSPLAWLGWDDCGRDMAAAGRMVQQPATLLQADLEPGDLSYRSTPSARVTFRYNAADREYLGRNMTFCSKFSAASVIDPFYDMLVALKPQVGREITVWVQPDRPENAVIHKYFPRYIMILAAFALFFGVGILAALDRKLMQIWQS
jgi:hypothetical protein